MDAVRLPFIGAIVKQLIQNLLRLKEEVKKSITFFIIKAIHSGNFRSVVKSGMPLNKL